MRCRLAFCRSIRTALTGPKTAPLSRFGRRSTARALAAAGVLLAGSLEGMTIVTPVSSIGPGSESATVERVRGRRIGCPQFRLGRIQFVTRVEGWATANSLGPAGHGLGVSAIVRTVDSG